MTKKLLAAMIIALSLLVAGCGNDSSSATQQNTKTDAGSSTASSLEGADSVCPAGQRPDASNTCAPCPDYEGCFTDPTQMRFFYDQIITMIDGYSKSVYANMPEPANWYYISPGDAGLEGCTDSTGAQASYTDRSYEYCPADQNVYVGEQRMWEFYSQFGDAAPAMGIVHEWGHHLQSIAGVRARADSLQEDFIAMENQADCIAGAWFGYEVAQGVANQDDAGDVDTIIPAIASAEEDPNRDHGTMSERTNSFISGMNQGIQACSAFFPDTPLVSP